METLEEKIEELEQAIKELRTTQEEHQQWCIEHVGKVVQVIPNVYFICLKHDEAKNTVRGFYIFNNYNDSKSIQFGEINLCNVEFEIVEPDKALIALRDIKDMIRMIEGLYIFENTTENETNRNQ